MSIGIPVVNAGELYVDGLELSWTADETVAIAAGSCRDSSNVNDIVVSAALSVSNIASGANGLDAGAVAASTFYAVYVIGSSYGAASPAGLLSLASNSAPTLPQDYDMYRRVGWVLTDGTSDNLLFGQYGSGRERAYYYDVAINELTGGSATSLTAIDMATSVPPIATQTFCKVTYTPNGATDVAQFGSYGGVAATGITQFGCGVAAAQVGMLILPCQLNSGAPTITYLVTSGDTLNVDVIGYNDFL